MKPLSSKLFRRIKRGQLFHEGNDKSIFGLK